MAKTIVRNKKVKVFYGYGGAHRFVDTDKFLIKPHAEAVVHPMGNSNVSRRHALSVWGPAADVIIKSHN